MPNMHFWRIFGRTKYDPVGCHLGTVWCFISYYTATILIKEALKKLQNLGKFPESLTHQYVCISRTNSLYYEL